MAKKEIYRTTVRLPDVSGEIYEKDDHYWQDVTERTEVTITYEDKKVRPKEFNLPLVRQWEQYPPPFHERYKMWADKWNLLISRKEWQEKHIDETTTAHDLGPIQQPTNAPVISKSHPQFWYGSVNCWACKVNGKFVFEDQIPKLVSMGCTGYHIEMFGWKGGLESDSNMTQIRSAYEKLVTMCRENKMWVFIDVINGNWNGPNTRWTAGVTNYSQLTVGYIVDHYGQTMIDIIKEHGPQNIIIQPVGEPGSTGHANDCKRFQDMCCDQLSDYVLVTETYMTNSSKMINATQHTTVHVSNDVPDPLDEDDRLILDHNDGIGAWSSSGGYDIVVSDNGTAIQALATPTEEKQGWLNRWTSATCRASHLRTYIDAYINKAAVVVYYAFKFKCMGTNGSTVDIGLDRGEWDFIKNKVDPKYPT